MTTKTIFSRKMAVYLRQQGFKILKTDVNRCKPEFDVYIFEDTPRLQEAISTYMSIYK